MSGLHRLVDVAAGLDREGQLGDGTHAHAALVVHARHFVRRQRVAAEGARLASPTRCGYPPTRPARIAGGCRTLPDDGDMDITTLHKNADRVASIFNALSIFVLVIGLIAATIVLIGGVIAALNSDSPAVGILGALVAGVYTAITWAGVQLAAVIAGYVKVRTTPGQPL